MAKKDKKSFNKSSNKVEAKEVKENKTEKPVKEAKEEKAEVKKEEPKKAENVDLSTKTVAELRELANQRN